MSHHTIHVTNVSFNYGKRRVLDDVSLQVHENEKVALIGPNGAGKSTLLMLLNGTLQAAAGHIQVGGLPLNDANIGQIRAWVGMIFADPNDQLFSPTVEQDVAFGPLHMALPEAEVRDRVARALEAVELSGYEDRLPYQLSTGEKRCAAIATVLSMEPKILALDEPASGMDPGGRRKLIALLRGLAQKTMLVATHDMDLVHQLCTRTIILSGGLIVAAGETDVILDNHALLERHNLY